MLLIFTARSQVKLDLYDEYAILNITFFKAHLHSAKKSEQAIPMHIGNISGFYLIDITSYGLCGSY